MNKNHMLGLAFKSIAVYLAKLEDNPENWHLAPVRGHNRVHKLFPFYPADLATLETRETVTVSKLFGTHLSGKIDKFVSPELLNSLAPDPSLQHKLRVFTRAFLQQPYHKKYASPQTNLAILMNLDINLSRRYCLEYCELLDTSIDVAPAYQNRIRDGIAIRPSQHAFKNAYNLL